MWCAPAETHAPSRSFSTASCAVGQSRPAPATRIFACGGRGLRERERLLDRAPGSHETSSPRSAAIAATAHV